MRLSNNLIPGSKFCFQILRLVPRPTPRMIQVDPGKRIPLRAIAAHSWILAGVGHVAATLDDWSVTWTIVAVMCHQLRMCSVCKITW
jgi:hypothetical protein